ncbi:hypothetical protein ASPCADRAFT_508897 [Aspergillus carbonarius ITEM 5010]|uniref:FAD dependent oxidoreductase domain-containing protein n=1 Tax=Aspergillus carbonarius (strain ITEM 5010) TaxID=602072 RepID=A0A1R3RF65_ASPC5|nr:hypothetical protein ASPCADRAFT_508897 [Aspergillus carbonarius ITEM 5010]
MTEKETIVVIGAGILGLTTALHLQSNLSPQQTILLCAREFPHSPESLNYASAWAGAHFRPVLSSNPALAREDTQAQRTYTHFTRLAAQEPGSGVQSLPGIEYLESPPAEYLDAENIQKAYGYLDGFQQLQGEDLPKDVKWGAKYTTFAVNPPVYCAWLLRQFVLRGGETREYTVVDLREGFYLAEGKRVRTVVNCSGLGMGDKRAFIIKGQTCLVRNPCSVTITRQNSDGSWSFCIPRPLGGGTIVGGTKQPHNWDPNPSLETRAKLLANAAKWFPFEEGSEKKFDVIRDIVGRRPAREGGIRIDAEKLSDDRGVIVHAYGAGGRGFELSWGIAEDVFNLMRENGLVREKASL